VVRPLSTAAADFGVEGPLVREQRFAIVPEWIIDATVSDCAFRLHAVLCATGNRPDNACPGGRCSQLGCARAPATPSIGRSRSSSPPTTGPSSMYGRRLWLQQQADADLTTAGQPVTRLAVARRAFELLDEAKCTPR